LEAKTLVDARKELADLKRRASPVTGGQSLSGTAPASGPVPEAPTLDGFLPRYLARAQLTKRLSTAKTEAVHLRRLAQYGFGSLTLSQITKARILSFRDDRLRDGWSPRTVNLALTVIRNLLRCARDEGIIDHDPVVGIQPLRHVPRRRPLFATGAIERLAEVAIRSCPRSGQILADFLRVLAYSGARCSEAVRLRWSDVDWGQRQLVIGSDGMTKNHETRLVDFNQRLEQVLLETAQRRPRGAEFLFSPTRSQGNHYRTLRETLLAARRAAGMPDFGFHDCRHHFVSYCVMSGIDFLTIARWVGHKDGGILIGKVYGHLSHEHLKSAAQRLRFETSADSGGMSQ
jgi:integrase